MAEENVGKDLLHRLPDGMNCGTFVVLYTYHITMNGWVTKSAEDANYLMFLGSLCFLAFFKETKIKSQHCQLSTEEIVSDTCFS